VNHHLLCDLTRLGLWDDVRCRALIFRTVLRPLQVCVRVTVKLAAVTVVVS